MVSTNPILASILPASLKMMITPRTLYLSTALSALGAFAQYPPPVTNLTQINPSSLPGAGISYKRVTDVCETTPGVNSYSGFVTLPATTLVNAGLWDPSIPRSLNTYFYYVQARHTKPKDAPLAIWIGGGPGDASFSSGIIFLAPLYSGCLTKEYFIKFSSTSTLWLIISFTSIQSGMDPQQQLSENTDVGSGSNQYVDASSQCRILIFPRCN